MDKNELEEGKSEHNSQEDAFGKKVEKKLKKEEINAEEFNESIKEGRILNTRLIALFVIGALIGITLKTHAVRTITMGFEDYKLARYADDFELEVAEEESAEEQEEVEQDENDGVIEEGADEEDVEKDIEE